MDRETETYYVLHGEEHETFLKQGGDPNATLLEMAQSSGQVIRPMAIDRREPYRGPIVVLVDRRSGSAGETFPAMVQAAGRGIVIGTRTAGAVLGGENFRLPGGYELFYPQADSVMPDGTPIEGHGVIPDLELTPHQAADDEFIYAIAVKALRGRTSENGSESSPDKGH